MLLLCGMLLVCVCVCVCVVVALPGVVGGDTFHWNGATTAFEDPVK